MRNLIERFGNISIINCDSKQVYEEILIITAQPPKQEVFYKLYGYVSAKKNYFVGLWLEDLEKEVNYALENAHIPIITGEGRNQQFNQRLIINATNKSGNEEKCQRI